MVSVGEAEKIILGHVFKPGKEFIPLERANGRSIAAEVTADRDLPPFDRATMDGIAISFQSFQQGQTVFAIEGLQAAGQPSQVLTDASHCFEIMTGAPLPRGTETVIPYEDVQIDHGIATISDAPVARQNVHRQGSDAKKGDVLLSPPFAVSPAEVALMASVGISSVEVFKNPVAAVISTGDELVDVTQMPLPHQIRKSNSYALASSLGRMGCGAHLFHLTDDEKALTTRLKEILDTYELVILSGGVSKGKFDFVPKVLEQLGVERLFHQVTQRPGKPMWFGRSEKNTVFALPGNPVSTFMCFHRYIKPWLEKSLGMKSHRHFAILTSDYTFPPSLTYFLQVKVENVNGKLKATPNTGGGSGDFANLKEVDGFLELPLERSEFKAGEVFRLIPFRGNF